MFANFKGKLFKLFDDLTQSGEKVPEQEVRKIISFGARGELEENYFLFIYRDFYRDPSYYGAVIFFNKKDEFENPVTTIGIEQNGKEQIRNIYVKAALFFLKNEFQPTMSLSGNAAVVFTMAKERINTFIGKKLGEIQVDELEQFDNDITSQAVEFQEIKHKKNDRKLHSRFLNDNLGLLQKNEKSGEETSETSKIRANFGLNLVSRYLDFSGERQIFFQPVFIPLKTDGQAGNPQKPDKSVSSIDFEWMNSSKLVEDFFDFFVFWEEQPGNPGLKVSLMNRVYFGKLAEEIFAFPEDGIFCQVDGVKEYQPLKTIKFIKVGIRFASSLTKESVYRFYLSFSSRDGLHLDAGDNYDIILLEEKVYILFTIDTEERWFAVPESLESTPHFSRLFAFLSAQQEFYLDDFDVILSVLRTIDPEHIIIHEKPLKKYELRFLPIPVLKIYAADGRMNKPQRLELDFDYREPLKGFLAEHPDKVVFKYQRDKKFEAQCQEVLKKDPLLVLQMDYHQDKKEIFHYYYFKEGDFLNWMIDRARKYLEKGFKIYSVKWKRHINHVGNKIGFHITAGIDWLEFKPYVRNPISGEEYEINLDSYDPQLEMIIDEKGGLHLVTPEEINKLAQLYRYADRHSNIFGVPSKNYVLIRQLYEKKMDEIPGIKDILTTESRLKEFEQIPDYPLSSQFRGQLRSYQQHGFKWLYFLQDYRFSGCLADDMGLGKTVQTLALLQTLREQEKLNTSLLVVPVSAIPNWEAEILRFTPGLTVHRHIGTGRDKGTGDWKNKDLIITSYATMRNDIELLKDFKFDYIILDESQNIKNLTSQVSKAAKILQGRNRLALSGTPIENNTMELWSLFDFLMPGFLGTYSWFNRQFTQGIEKEEDPEKGELLKKMIYPFVMRRKKEDVEKELPEKIEIVTRLSMEEEQLKLYGEIADLYRKELDHVIAEKGVPGASLKILEGMLRLRQICLFPRLADEKFKDIPSAKFDYLKELLEDILAEDHKVLVFSQFVQVLKIIKDYCDQEKLTYSYLDGSVHVNAREKMVKAFQEDKDTRVFLLSLKAGGVALNLTAADYVIIFDPWWNPAVEAQAVDRSHRIGQDKKVIVYRMVVKESIEEKMLALQEQKKALVENLIASDTLAFKKLSREEILDLFNI